MSNHSCERSLVPLKVQVSSFFVSFPLQQGLRGRALCLVQSILRPRSSENVAAFVLGCLCLPVTVKISRPTLADLPVL